MTLPSAVAAAAAPYLADPRTRVARIGFLHGMLQGIALPPVSEAALIRGLEDMAVAGADFRPVVVRTWCARAQKLLEGEAGAREALKGQSSVLGPPDANTGHPSSPSGWDEEELG